METIASFFQSTMFTLVAQATWQTLVMVFLSTIFSMILGLPVGILLHITSSEEQGGIIPHPVFYNVLSRIVNILRSFPFIILMIVLMPLSRLIIGTSIGTMATVIEVDPGVVQAARAMGSTNWQIILKVLIPEALPSLVSGVTLTIINLIGYSAMAGAIGGGGLGDLAIRYGYQRFSPSYMVFAVIVIIVMVEVIQFIGDKISAHLIAKR